MKKVRRFTVDLSVRDPEERLKGLLDCPWAVGKARLLADRANEEMLGYVPCPALLGPTLRGLSSVGLWAPGRGSFSYSGETQAWARKTGRTFGHFASANLAYEWTQVGSWLAGLFGGAKQAFGFCSSVAFYRPGLGMVHARNMDWPLKGFREATVLIDYVNGPAGDFTSVSVPGQVGMLSGVGKGRFSATVNMAPAIKPNLKAGWPAQFLVRHMFETCGSYGDAKAFLLKATSMVPVFVQIVGPEKGQACVVEVMPRGDNFYWEWDRGPLAITNHEPDDPEYEDRDDGEWHTDSIPRLKAIRKAAGSCKAKTLRGCLAVVGRYPVFGTNTQQSMMLNVKTGEVTLG